MLMWSDGYLHLRGVQRGYAAVIWRGRYVVEPTELTQEQAVAFWFDVLQVSRAMQVVYRPLKMNYQTCRITSWSSRCH
jgi:diadenosine tetraphosphate (Ap4A) HIT family hydrolase